MKRTVIKIDEELCNGCGACVNGCHEGALQLIDGKARMVSDLYCDGLGACIGECPAGAIEFEAREAEPYSEYAVMERISSKGEKTIRAHLLHLKTHNEIDYVKQGLNYLKEHNIKIDLSGIDVTEDNPGVEAQTKPPAQTEIGHDNRTASEKSVENKIACGCPGMQERSFVPQAIPDNSPTNTNSARDESPQIAIQQHQYSRNSAEIASQLRQWPIQLHLLNPEAQYFRLADIVLAADCTAYAYGDFHNRFLKNHTLAIACPKLDSNKEAYIEKLTAMIDHSLINTLTVIIMEVPCCGGLLQIAKLAVSNAKRRIPVKLIVVGIEGNLLKEEWV